MKIDMIKKWIDDKRKGEVSGGKGIRIDRSGVVDLQMWMSLEWE